MNISQLVQGDLVYREDTGQVIKVDHNYGRSIVYKIEHSAYEVIDTKLSPITLTEEILEKNGFQKTGRLTHQTKDGVVILDAQYWELTGRTDDDKYYRVSVNLETTQYESPYIYVSCLNGYTHYNHNFTCDQLQHALRFYEINNLADNLKV